MLQGKCYRVRLVGLCTVGLSDVRFQWPRAKANLLYALEWLASLPARSNSPLLLWLRFGPRQDNSVRFARKVFRKEEEQLNFKYLEPPKIIQFSCLV